MIPASLPEAEAASADGRFAPSPTGPLHLGSLRTALLGWLFARSAGARFLLRVEDLDPVASRTHHVESHIADLRAVGIDWDGPIVHQSARLQLYREAIADLQRADLLYPCFCTRREILDAVAAPHGPLPDGAYPGTCLTLTSSRRRSHERTGRRPALRVRAGAATATIVDRLRGEVSAVVDDFVVQRNDGLPAYNLAVVVDDHHQGIGEVVRGADLLTSAPRQAWVAGTLGLRVPVYAHVPLVLGADGARLAKRHGSVTLADLGARGVGPDQVRDLLATSVGLPPLPLGDLVAVFSPLALPLDPWTPPAGALGAAPVA